MDNPTTPTDAAFRCIGFFASVIKSGEKWSPVCDEMMRAALASTPAVTRRELTEDAAFQIAHRIYHQSPPGYTPAREQILLTGSELVRFFDIALKDYGVSPVHQPCAATVAYEYVCKRAPSGGSMTYASVDENDSMHWPMEQWRSVVRTPLAPCGPAVELKKGAAPSADGVAGDSKPASGHTT